MRLKPIQDQVVVVLGASSGIGRELALRFGERGAKVVVAARTEEGLASLVNEIEQRGGRGLHVVCDVALPAEVERVAEAAVEAFGRIDTWVNVAAVSVYARFEDTTPEEFRRVMEVNYLGQIHGALSALPRLRANGGGALIAVSSVESSVSLPLTSAYAASKHALEGALDALRRELMAEGVPISVTSVKPATINTPLFNNARNKLDVVPKGPPPVYEPGVVADCVLYAAAHPVRDMYAGGAARMMMVGQLLAPGLLDRLLSRVGISSQRSDTPRTESGTGNLDAPRAHDNRVEGDYGEHARRFSLYTWMETHPAAVRLLAATGMLVGTTLLASRVRHNGSGMRV
jgi:NAD(P)-dependent dehydrogenase (short-subunit alcohol dehydrogenase family)